MPDALKKLPVAPSTGNAAARPLPFQGSDDSSHFFYDGCQDGP